MSRGRYIVGVLVVAAIGAGLQYWQQNQALEEPIGASSGGGLMDMYADDMQKASDFFNGRPEKAPPGPR